jgi:hypothetical protein
MKKEYFQLTRPMIILFILLNGLLVAFQHKLESKKISIDVVVSANLLLFLVSMANIYFQMKSLRNPNPNASIRGLMAGTFLKLFVLAAAAMIYLFAAGEDRSVNAVFVGMGLYIIYTWMEVKISLRLNPKK